MLCLQRYKYACRKSNVTKTQKTHTAKIIMIPPIKPTRSHSQDLDSEFISHFQTKGAMAYQHFLKKKLNTQTIIKTPQPKKGPSNLVCLAFFRSKGLKPSDPLLHLELCRWITLRPSGVYPPTPACKGERALRRVLELQQ